MHREAQDGAPGSALALARGIPHGRPPVGNGSCARAAMRARSPRRRPLRPSNATASPPQSCAAEGGAPWQTRRPPPQPAALANSSVPVPVSPVSRARPGKTHRPGPRPATGAPRQPRARPRRRDRRCPAGRSVSGAGRLREADLGAPRGRLVDPPGGVPSPTPRTFATTARGRARFAVQRVFSGEAEHGNHKPNFELLTGKPFPDISHSDPRTSSICVAAEVVGCERRTDASKGYGTKLVLLSRTQEMPTGRRYKMPHDDPD